MAQANDGSSGPKKKSLLEKIREKDFPGIKKDIDEGIYQNVVEPMAKAGYETAGPAVGAAMGAAADFALPDDMADVGLMAMGPLGKVGKVASVAKKLHLEDAKKFLSPEKYAAAAEEVRTRGYSHLMDEAGNILGTIGQHSAAGKAMAGEARAAKNAQEAASRGIDYTKLDTAVDSAAKAEKKVPKISGEAAEVFEKTGVDPTRKNAVSYMEELRKKKAAEMEALRKK